MGSRTIRAVTDIDSGRDLAGWIWDVVLKRLVRLCSDSERSRSLKASGDDSRDIEGEGVFRVRDSARSAIEGDFRPPAFRTEKKEGDETGGPVGVPVAAGAALESFSNALIL